ncbi:Uma2 family endonuclease [bacterium]|nr:Uma2 family endonuclease [bacterium]
MEPMAIEASFRSEERFTQAQFRAWIDARPPRDVGRYELLRGQIVMSPPALPRHGRVEVSIASLLDRHVSERTLGLVFGSSTGFELVSGDTLSPDVAFVSLARLEGASLDEFFGLAPDLAVEILSPSSISRDRVEKLSIYAENGVAEYWIVDPRRRTVEIHRLVDGAYAEPEVFGAGRIRSTVLPSFDAPVDAVFSGLD